MKLTTRNFSALLRAASAAVVASALLACWTARAQPEAVNLTRANKEAFLNKVEALKETEFVKIERGRPRLDPIWDAQVNHYAAMLYAPEKMLDRQLESYQIALNRFWKGLAERPEWSQSERGRTIAGMLEAHFLDLYDITPEIEEAQTIEDLWRAVEASRFSMQSVPVKLNLALNVLDWMDELYKGSPWPEGTHQALLSLVGDSENPVTVAEYSKYVDSLFARASELFMREMKSGGGNS